VPFVTNCVTFVTGCVPSVTGCVAFASVCVGPVTGCVEADFDIGDTRVTVDVLVEDPADWAGNRESVLSDAPRIVSFISYTLSQEDFLHKHTVTEPSAIFQAAGTVVMPCTVFKKYLV
jgi:hypothetical protein